MQLKKRPPESFHKLHKELKLSLRGPVEVVSNNSLYRRDFGNILFRNAKLLVHLTCENDVKHLFRLANLYQTEIAFRGAGHSSNGQTLTEDIVALNCMHQTQKPMLFKNRTVLVPTSLTWRELETFLNQNGLSCPILTGSLSTTVGGTLSVGGIGMRSFKYGGQIDQVLKIKLILPRGRSLWCSSNKNRELFQFSLGGMGALGFMAYVVLRTIPYQQTSITYSHTIQNIKYTKNHIQETFHQFIKILKNKFPFDRIGARIIKPFKGISRPELVYGYEYPASEAPYDNSEPIELRALEENRRKGKLIALDYVVDLKKSAKFINYISRIRKRRRCFKCFNILYFRAIKRPAYSPTIPFHPAKFKRKAYISIGLYFNPSTKKEVVEVQMLAKELLHLCLTLGGRPYLQGEHHLSHEINEMLYGSSYTRFVRLKKKLDPNEIISFDKLWLNRGHSINPRARKYAQRRPYLKKSKFHSLLSNVAASK